MDDPTNGMGQSADGGDHTDDTTGGNPPAGADAGADTGAAPAGDAPMGDAPAAGADAPAAGGDDMGGSHDAAHDQQ